MEPIENIINLIDSLLFIGLFAMWLTVINITFWAAVEIDRDQFEENTRKIPVHDMTGEESFIELEDQEEGEYDGEPV